jgi:hypothetical protein
MIEGGRGEGSYKEIGKPQGEAEECEGCHLPHTDTEI